ncbi:MAG: putative porin, partial [Verrucomicrobiae bacterium]|nr:putative porin [Verrucomicrobiae bacterium]
ITGRFDNPFFRVSEIQWDNDLGFDGFALTLKHQLTEGITPFFTGGIFPIFNTAFNFPDNMPDKYESTDKWIYGMQFGVDLKGDQDDVNAKLGMAYYDFDNVQGELSEPFIPFSTKDAGSTDNLRPSFAQKGNTYMPLRDIIPDPLNGFGTAMQYQYFGLASDFNVISYNGKIDLNFFEPIQISLLGEFGKNLGFDQEEIDAIAVNNRGPIPAADPEADPAAAAIPEIGAFEGGNEAWMLAIQFGHSAFEKAGDWNAQFGYRYVESDAYIDGFTDSDFGLGGTNVEGYTASLGIALSPSVNINLRWMGSNEIAGPPLKSDVIIFDLNASF